ncbi:MAG: CCA tRNA nucleotidyltransferase, partial [Candidatus Woesearchaeota archaeon]|nr:CCA tRNA nucleotidyltransferase [Candidatus Woesearchaeota archaeon]
KVKSNVLDAKAVLGGSGAKGTWLRGMHDADMFVLFDYEKFKGRSEEISDILEKSIKKVFKNLIRLHGSRDYFQLKRDGFTYEIIPILEIKKANDAMNITDISPLHAKWVNKHKKLRDEILLTKQFCKANNCYGAESYIKGFSGYICEILTIYYGGFLNLVKNAAKWKGKVVIDVEGYHKGKDVMFELNKSKTYSPIIVVDPVQKERNASAALSEEKFEVFRSRCKEFVRKPSKNFFEIEKIDLDKLEKKAVGKNLLILDVKALEGKEDVVGAKLLKVYEHIVKMMKFYEFNVLSSGWEWEEGSDAMFYFIVDKKELSKTKLQMGPPLKVKEHVNEFKKKHKNAFEKNGKVYADVKRKFVNVIDMVKDEVGSEYVKGRVGAVKIR